MIVTGPEMQVVTANDGNARTLRLRELSEEFEAVFLAAMLKESGINKTDGSFSGGAGEEAFASMLTDQYALKIAERGGIGIAEHVFRALTKSGVR